MKAKTLKIGNAVLLAALLLTIFASSAFAAPFSFIIWYTLPPTINYNPLASQSITSGANTVSCVAPLFAFHPYKGLFFPVLGKDITLNTEEGYLEVTLWPDNYWWDGENLSPFTAKDVWTYYMLQWKIFNNFQPWLLDIEVVDDYTIRFYFNESEFTYKATAIDDPSKEFSYSFKSKIWYSGFFQLLTWSISTPYKIFGHWAEMVADVPVGQVQKKFNLTDIQNEIYSYQMDKPWCNGPFWLDPSTLTTTGINVVKNPGYRWSRYIKYENGEVLFARAEEQMVAWLMEGRDLATWHGVSPISLVEVDKSPGGVKAVYLWNFEIQGIWFNIAKYPFNITKVRQALTMLIDAAEAGNAYPPMFSVAYNDYITGLSKSEELPEYVRNNLYDWSYNPEKAYKLLEEAGFTQKDGKWYLPNGQPFKVEILSVSAWADWVALASNIQSQLQQHGIDAEVRSVDVGVYNTLWENWDFDITLNWDVANPLGISLAYTAFLNRLWPAWQFEVSKYNYTWPVPLKNGTTIYVNPNVEQMKLQAAVPGSPEFYDAVAKLAWFWNYYLPTVPMWNVRRSWQLSIKQSNYAELLGKPTEMVDISGYSVPYYGPDQSWLLAAGWGMYPPILWMSYGILYPPESPMEWPPTTAPKDVLKMLPPEVKIISIESLGKAASAEEVPPTPTPEAETEIQKLNETIAELQTTINELKSNIDTLTSKVNSLESQLSQATAAADAAASAAAGMQTIAYSAIGLAILSLIIAAFAVMRAQKKE